MSHHKPVRRLEAVTVCMDYSDFLAETLPHNMQHFDHMVVITSDEDRETRELCDHLGVECRTTNVHKRSGDKFAKSRAIDYGLAYIRADDWVVHLDADIWLPPMTRHILTHMNLDHDSIYGIDRVNCVGYDRWDKFLAGERRGASRHQHIRNCLTVPPPFPMGARISIKHYGGFIPIGFFQMWNAGRHPNRRYPLHHGGAERTDVLHSLQWPEEHRRLLAEIIGIHLESEPGRMGVNWNGRMSKQFGSWDPFRHRRGEAAHSKADLKGYQTGLSAPCTPSCIEVHCHCHHECHCNGYKAP
jgi:hypothetical protein